MADYSNIEVTEIAGEELKAFNARRSAYLDELAKRIDAARALADEWPAEDGWGGGLAFGDSGSFGYGNTSDLLSDLAAVVREAAASLKGDA